MNPPIREITSARPATMLEQLEVLSESLKDAKTPPQRLSVLNDMQILFEQLLKGGRIPATPMRRSGW